jgi:hypothetical protein
VTDCDCSACQRAGGGLLRFDSSRDGQPTEMKREVSEHDALALSRTIQQIMSSPDPAAELKHRRVNAAFRSRSVASSLQVQLNPPPTWLDSWD